MELGGPAVECQTRNQESLGSNPLCYHFEVWEFSFSAQCLTSLRCINEYLSIDGGGNVIKSSSRVIAARMLPREVDLVPE